MSRRRFTLDQISSILLEWDAGGKPKDLSRLYGISAQTLYRWRATYGKSNKHTKGRLRSLEIENRRLKQRFAELSLDYASLRTALIKDVNREC
jgi:putative transposase